MQAQGVVDGCPRAITLLGGASTDNNARLFREGQMNVLAAGGQGRHQDRGRAMDAGMGSVKAQAIIENALNANSNNIRPSSPRTTARPAARSGADQPKLAGKVAVSGQDADLAGVRRGARRP